MCLVLHTYLYNAEDSKPYNKLRILAHLRDHADRLGFSFGLGSKISPPCLEVITKHLETKDLLRLYKVPSKIYVGNFIH